MLDVRSSPLSFLDPSITEIANIRPASITNGAPTVASSGTTAAALQADFKNLLGLVTTNLIAPYFVMKPTVAVALATLDDTGGFFRNVGAHGGQIAGVPVITSANVPTDANSPSNDVIILVDAAEILLAEGGLEIDASAQATLDLQTIPDSPPTAATVQTNLWQNNMSALRANRFIRWKARRPGVSAMLTGVAF
jgi:hypothetical protein